MAHPVSMSLLATTALLLVGCQMQPVTDPVSPLYRLPAGSTITLHRPVTIAPEHAHVYIQYGKTGAPSLYYPNCKLWVNDISPRPQTVEPGEFNVTRVRRMVNIMPLVNLQGLRIAGPLTVLAQGGGGGDDGSSFEMYVTEMRLHSDTQPDVRKLECQQLDDPGLGEHVSAVEINNTLYPLATLTIPNVTLPAPDGSVPPGAPGYSRSVPE